MAEWVQLVPHIQPFTPLEIRTLEIHTPEIHTPEIHTLEIQTLEIHTLDVRTLIRTPNPPKLSFYHVLTIQKIDIYITAQ